MTAALREALGGYTDLAEFTDTLRTLAEIVRTGNQPTLAAELERSAAVITALSAQVPEDDARLVERLRSSAKAFREHPVYTQDGDGCCLTVQADEMDQAADRIEVLSSGQGRI